MKPSRSFWQTLKLAVLALAGWVAGCGVALAERTPDAPKTGGGATDYTLGYFLLILGVVLGLLFVLHTSNRRERDKPEGYVAKNILKDE